MRASRWVVFGLVVVVLPACSSRCGDGASGGADATAVQAKEPDTGEEGAARSPSVTPERSETEDVAEVDVGDTRAGADADRDTKADAGSASLPAEWRLRVVRNDRFGMGTKTLHTTIAELREADGTMRLKLGLPHPLNRDPGVETIAVPDARRKSVLAAAEEIGWPKLQREARIWEVEWDPSSETFEVVLEAGDRVIFAHETPNRTDVVGSRLAHRDDLARVLRLLSMAADAEDVEPGEIRDEMGDVAWLEEGCDDGIPERCGRLADRYAEGRGVKKSRAKELELLEHACDLGNAFECKMLAERFLEGRDAEKDPAKAADLYRRGCEHGAPMACSKFSEFLREGEAVERDVERALEIDRRLCSGQGPIFAACQRVAESLESDHPKLAKLRKDCEGGDESTCIDYGVALLDHMPNHGGRRLRNLCKDDSAEGCVAAATAWRDGHGVEKSTGRAVRYFEDACELSRDSVGCKELAEMLEAGSIKSNYRRDNAIETLETACEAGHIPSCDAVP